MGLGGGGGGAEVAVVGLLFGFDAGAGWPARRAAARLQTALQPEVRYQSCISSWVPSMLCGERRCQRDRSSYGDEGRLLTP